MDKAEKLNRLSALVRLEKDTKAAKLRHLVSQDSVTQRKIEEFSQIPFSADISENLAGLEPIRRRWSQKQIKRLNTERAHLRVKLEAARAEYQKAWGRERAISGLIERTKLPFRYPDEQDP